MRCSEGDADESTADFKSASVEKEAAEETLLLIAANRRLAVAVRANILDRVEIMLKNLLECMLFWFD